MSHRAHPWSRPLVARKTCGLDGRGSKTTLALSGNCNEPDRDALTPRGCGGRLPEHHGAFAFTTAMASRSNPAVVGRSLGLLGHVTVPMSRMRTKRAVPSP